MKHYWFEGLNF